MTPTVWSVAILVAAAAGLLALRTLSGRIRIALDIVCLVALSVVLHQRGASPFPGSSAAAPDIATLWLRVLIVAWWLASARVVVGVLYFALRHDRRHRSAKLVVDLIAAAIYVGTVVIVLKSVLALPVAGLFATSGVVAIVLGLALQSTLADVFSGIAVGIEAPFQVGDRESAMPGDGGSRARHAGPRWGRLAVPRHSGNSSVQRGAHPVRPKLESLHDHVLRGGDVVGGGNEEPPAPPRRQAAALRRPARARPGRPGATPGSLEADDSRASRGPWRSGAV